MKAGDMVRVKFVGDTWFNRGVLIDFYHNHEGTMIVNCTIKPGPGCTMNGMVDEIERVEN